MSILRGLLGLIFILAIAFFFSEQRKKIQWKIVVIGLGFQILFEGSHEHSFTQGLGVFPGVFEKIPDTDVKVPHMGWNDVFPKSHPLFKGMTDPQFYFLHSYYFSTDSTTGILAETEYAGRFASAVNNQMIFGVQFHPEKSHHWGVQLLKNFAEI